MKNYDQKKQVMTWFKAHKYINKVDAMNSLNPPIWNLPDVIMRLRNEGVPIETEQMRKGKRYVKYYLGEEYGRKTNVCQDNHRE